MNKSGRRGEFQRLSTPRSAVVAGIAFTVLFAASIVLLRTALPRGALSPTAWARDDGGRIGAALALMPFAGIAFLWFIGVVRDLLGEYEDRFFSTVFFGSGILFLAMVFVSCAVAGATLAAAKLSGNEKSLSGDRVLRSSGDASGQQHLRLANGRRLHDLARHDLVAHGLDAAVAGHPVIPRRADALGRDHA